MNLENKDTRAKPITGQENRLENCWLFKTSKFIACYSSPAGHLKSANLYNCKFVNLLFPLELR